MGAAPSLSISPERATSLQAYIQIYRHYAFAALLPTTERNNILRALQTIQGKIIEASAQKQAIVQVGCTIEELTTLKTMLSELLVLYAKQPESDARIAILNELAILKNLIRA